MRLLSLITAALLSVALFSGAASAADSRYGKQKVVYHINYNGGEDDKAYRAALRNVLNHIEAVGRDNIEVKVVLHGDGVYLLKDAIGNEKLASAVTNLKTMNVSFAVCNNTLVGRKIDYKKELFEVFDDNIVPSGVAELSYLQQKGYTYIKP